MTAEEIIKETLLKYGYKTIHIGRPYEVLNTQFIHKRQVDELKELIDKALKEKWDEACEAHKQSCLNQFQEGQNKKAIVIRLAILNAPKPEYK